MSDIVVTQADALDCRVVAHDWAFAREEAAFIERHWQSRLDAGQKIWNGRVLLSCDADIVEGAGRKVFRSNHFETDYAAFLAFRELGFPEPGVRNCFAMAALRAADGHYLLARMSAHTANAGQIYFAAGTPDPGDIVGDRLDLAGSVMRELREETGLTEDDVSMSEGYTIVFDSGRIACLRDVRTHDDAASVIARVKAFLEKEETPEIDGLVAIRSAADLSAGHMPPFQAAFLRAKLKT